MRNPRDAQALGVGMVYQHFTLVPSLTAAENLVASRADAPAIINWRKERARSKRSSSRMPFRVPLDRPVSSLAAGEKQKLEILKLLYLNQRFLILDEPTSVLTPGEADEILGLLQGHGASRRDHGADDHPQIPRGRGVLRRRQRAAARRQGRRRQGRRTLDARDGGDDDRRRRRAPVGRARQGAAKSERRSRSPGCFVENDEGRDAVAGFDLKVKAGEIVGIAGVSGNGQSELVEALSGQRPIKLGQVLIDDQNFEPKRDHFDTLQSVRPARGAAEERHRADHVGRREHGVPQPSTSRRSPSFGWWLSPGPMRARARELIARYNVKTPSPDTPIRDLSGGNVQRAVLARELSDDVDVLIVANPCFGLDFVSVADIRAQIMDQRNRGAAVLLVSEDLDEILELSDRIAVMSEGKVAYLTDAAGADRTTIGRHMAGH